MKLINDVFQVLCRKGRIDLGTFKRLIPKQYLYISNTGTVLQHMDGAGVPHEMRMNAFCAPAFLKYLVYYGWTERISQLCQKKLLLFLFARFSSRGRDICKYFSGTTCVVSAGGMPPLHYVMRVVYRCNPGYPWHNSPLLIPPLTFLKRELSNIFQWLIRIFIIHY